jgi:hypothetical protein
MSLGKVFHRTQLWHELHWILNKIQFFRGVLEGDYLTFESNTECFYLMRIAVNKYLQLKREVKEW